MMSIKPFRDALIASTILAVLMYGFLYLAAGMLVDQMDASSVQYRQICLFVVGGCGTAVVALFAAVFFLKKRLRTIDLDNQHLYAQVQALHEQEASLSNRQGLDRDETQQLYGKFDNFIDQTKQSVSLSLTGLDQLGSSASEMLATLKELKTKTNLYRSSIEDASVRVMETLKIADNMMDVNHKVNAALVMIPKITAQINLVALNATIEASRAGDVGKGFAVVASEVKKLAMETFDVTKNITEYLGEGNSAAQQASDLVSRMVNVMHETKGMIEGTVQTISDHVDNVENMQNSVEMLSSEIHDLGQNIEGFQAETLASLKRA